MPPRFSWPEKITKVPPAVLAGAAVFFFLTTTFFLYRVHLPPKDTWLVTEEDGIAITWTPGHLTYDATAAVKPLQDAVTELYRKKEREAVPPVQEEMRLLLKNPAVREESLLYKGLTHTLRWTVFSWKVTIPGGQEDLLQAWRELEAAVTKVGGRIWRVDTTASTASRVVLRFDLRFPVKVRGEGHWLPVQVVTMEQVVDSSPARASSLTEKAKGSWAGVTLALVIDDWGYETAAVKRMLELPVPLTMAVIPGLPGSLSQAWEGKERGWEVLLHLPMEPLAPSWPLDRMVIRVGMDPGAIRERIATGLASVPGAIGVNNHMGSRATGDLEVMRAVLAEMRRRGLFFVDSHTSPHSVVSQVAKAMGVAVAVNQTFLDNVADPATIKKRLWEAVEKAGEEGRPVIAIGHVRPAMVEVLAEVLPELATAGVRLVPVSEVIQK